MTDYYDLWDFDNIVAVHMGDGMALINDQSKKKVYSCHPKVFYSAADGVSGYLFDKKKVELNSPYDTIAFFLCECDSCKKAKEELIRKSLDNGFLKIKDTDIGVCACLVNDISGEWIPLGDNKHESAEELLLHMSEDEIAGNIYEQISYLEDDDKVYIYADLKELNEQQTAKWKLMGM